MVNWIRKIIKCIYPETQEAPSQAFDLLYVVEIFKTFYKKYFTAQLLNWLPQANQSHALQLS
jgi:hypothetical protein